MKAISFIFLTFFVLSNYVMADESVNKILKNIDELYRSMGSQGKIETEVITPEWSRTMKMDMWTKGLDYIFIRIKEPRKDKGVSSLKREDAAWNIFPKINKVIKVPPSMMMGSWMGSDFTNDDLVKESSLIKDYKTTNVKESDGNIEITLVPHKNTVSLWGKILLVVEKKSELPLKQEYFDERNEKIRILFYRDVKKFGNRTIPATMELQPLTKKGHKTIIRYKEVEFDANVPATTFTLTNLQKRR